LASVAAMIRYFERLLDLVSALAVEQFDESRGQTGKISGG
jgi:hypothetical protein